ncbi:MAG TPA: hypothetical protein VD932_05315 [Aquabacterium sp.]|nr:hypothetical protein [Aquabacterium sp.]
MQVSIEAGVLQELQHIVDLHRRYGADYRLDTVERLVSFVLTSVAEGSRRPDAWERTLLEVMGLVAYCSEHEQDRGSCGHLPERESATLASGADQAPPGCLRLAECDDAATLIAETVQLLFRAVSALRSVRAVFDTSEYRDPERWPRECAALREVYVALDLPWPTDDTVVPE